MNKEQWTFAGVVIGAITAILVWEQNEIAKRNSPDGYAERSELAYSVWKTNDVSSSPYSSKLVVHVVNRSKNYAARNVNVLLKPLTNNPRISSNARIRELDATDGKLVIIDRVPPWSYETITIDESIAAEAVPSSYADDWGFASYCGPSFCGEVVKVTTDRGSIEQNDENSFDRTTQPPVAMTVPDPPVVAPPTSSRSDVALEHGDDSDPIAANIARLAEDRRKVMARLGITDPNPQ